MTLYTYVYVYYIWSSAPFVNGNVKSDWYFILPMTVVLGMGAHDTYRRSGRDNAFREKTIIGDHHRLAPNP